VQTLPVFTIPVSVLLDALLEGYELLHVTRFYDTVNACSSLRVLAIYDSGLRLDVVVLSSSLGYIRGD